LKPIHESLDWTRLYSFCPKVVSDYFPNSSIVRFVPQEEGLVEVGKRYMELLHEVGRRHAGETVLVVSHGQLFTEIYRHVDGHAVSGIPYTGILCLDRDKDGQFSLVERAQAEHLA